MTERDFDAMLGVMDATNKAAHIAYYGEIAIERRYCEDCKRFAFFIDGEMRCCGAKLKTAEKPKQRRRMCDVHGKRKGPPKRERDRILREQRDNCFWCDRGFGRSIWLGRKRIILRVEWDHIVPFGYSRNNSTSNFVAACHVCNRIKSAVIFESIEEYRVHIWNEWKAKGYTDLRPVRGEIYPETPTSKIL